MHNVTCLSVFLESLGKVTFTLAPRSCTSLAPVFSRLSGRVALYFLYPQMVVSTVDTVTSTQTTPSATTAANACPS